MRDSTNFPGDFTLCMAFKGKVEHYRWACTFLTVRLDFFFLSEDHIKWEFLTVTTCGLKKKKKQGRKMRKAPHFFFFLMIFFFNFEKMISQNCCDVGLNLNFQAINTVFRFRISTEGWKMEFCLAYVAGVTLVTLRICRCFYRYIWL